MAFGALASGLIGATQAAGEDAGQRMKLANEEASRKRILDMTEEANMDFKKRLDEYTFQKEGERLPETLRREGLMNQAKYSPEIIAGERALAAAKRDPQEIGLRKLQLEKAGLELNRAKEEAKIPAAELKVFDSLGKRASAYESAILKAQADGNFDANSDSGKKMLGEYQSVIQRQQEVLSPYLKHPLNKPDDGGITHKYGADGRLLAVKSEADKASAEKPTAQSGDQLDADTAALQNAYAVKQKSDADSRTALIAKFNRDMENVKSIKDPKARAQAVANLQDGARKSGIL